MSKHPLSQPVSADFKNSLWVYCGGSDTWEGRGGHPNSNIGVASNMMIHLRDTCCLGLSISHTLHMQSNASQRVARHPNIVAAKGIERATLGQSKHFYATVGGMPAAACLSIRHGFCNTSYGTCDFRSIKALLVWFSRGQYCVHQLRWEIACSARHHVSGIKVCFVQLFVIRYKDVPGPINWNFF